MEVRTEVAFLWSENVIFLCNSLCCVLYFLWHRFLVDDVLTKAYFFAKLEKMFIYFWCKCVYIYLKWNKGRGNIRCLSSVLIAVCLTWINTKAEKRAGPSPGWLAGCPGAEPGISPAEVSSWPAGSSTSAGEGYSVHGAAPVCSQPGQLRRHCCPCALPRDENWGVWWVICTKVAQRNVWKLLWTHWKSHTVPVS